MIRRRLISLLIIATIAPILASVSSDVQPVMSQDGFYAEAPMLAERVAAEELPPVDERLPTNPMLLQPVERVGTYGGLLEIPVTSPQEEPLVSRMIGYESLLRWDAQWLRVIPNIAQSYDVSPDARTYTFHLREGIRWSDGAAFSVDDIMFWYEDVFSNPELTARPANWLSTDGVPVAVEKIDDFTVIFRFAAPNSFFPMDFANAIGNAPVNYPRHYMQQFHPKYNPDLDNLLAAEQVDSWVELFTSKNVVRNTALPRLGAWIVVENSPDRIIADRNPYYWKIDEHFKQLPYIDRILFTHVPTLEDYEAIVANDNTHLIMTAEFDDYSVLGSPPSDLQSVTLISSYSTAMAIGLNLNHPDPQLRAFFQNRDVRIALSHAINRQRIVDEVFEGNSQPYQVAPRPESPFYDATMATQYTVYDVELANEILDSSGFALRNADGFRLGSHGEPISFALQHNTPSQSRLRMMEMVVDDWRAIGIDVQLEVYDAEHTNDYFSILLATMHDTYISDGVGGLAVISEPAYYFPVHQFASFYASGWAYWYVDSENENAVEPPLAIQDQMQRYTELRATSDLTRQSELMSEILAIAREEFLVIGTVLSPNATMLISPNLHNVPSLMPLAFVYPTPAPTNPAQYFIEP